LNETDAQPRRPARQEQNTKEKFCFPFRRKNLARANQKMRRKLFAGWRALASDGGAERQFRSKKVRAFSNKGHQIFSSKRKKIYKS